MIVKLPGGSLVDVPETVTGITDPRGAEIRLHVPQALGRLISYWHDKQNMRALVSDYLSEVQEIENAIWQVILLRLPDYAGTAQLDVLGAIVGEARDGLGNSDYLLRIKARIRANSSFGSGADVIAVLRLITSARFRFSQAGNAAFSVDFVETPTDAAMRQVPGLIRDTRAAGVGASVSFVTNDARNARYGSVYAGSLNIHGYSSFYDSSVGGKYGHLVVT